MLGSSSASQQHKISFKAVVNKAHIIQQFTKTIMTTYLHALIEQLEYGAVGNKVIDLVRETLGQATEQVQGYDHEVLVWCLVLLWV